MIDIQTTYKYDERKKELKVIRSHDLMHPVNKEEVVGKRELVDYYDEAGIRAMVKELNAQKNSYEKQSKVLMQQIEGASDVEVDEEFLEKLKAAKTMEGKKQKVDQLKNADDQLKEINRQLNDVKGAVGSRIKW